MQIPTKHRLFLLVALSLLSLATRAAPLSPYYLTNGDDRRLVIITDDTYSYHAQGQSEHREYPIAVYDGIFAAGPIASEQPGGIYDLTGSFVSAATGFAAAGSFWDGTTDGLYNYAVNFSTGGVYRFDTDWSNATLEFVTAANPRHVGITYDPTDDSFWLAQWQTNDIEHRDRNGNVLGTFTVGLFDRYLTALALDHADGTLWVGSRNQPGIYAQYSKTGDLLSTATYLFADNTLGGEFNFINTGNSQIVPLPAAGWLFLSALATLAIRRRRLID